MRNVFKVAASVAAAVILAAGLTACTGGNDDLAAQYRAGTDKGYIAGDFRVKEYGQNDRPAAIAFAGTLEDGKKVSAADYAGTVTVVNFWYSSCAPCRQEAPLLEKAAQQFEGRDVAFLGVNTYDQAATAASFAKEFGVTYPSVIDVDTKSVTASFADVVPLSATPSTVVLGKDGRPTARIIGALPDASILTSLITTALDEK
ncbi:TlpA family protein disulfide reductase [Microbacterium elymi]|uniref:TlpA family protein disulfide reductase n=1 Tax=Microbacterium elymi TaxID=2909587 RepID=A0ABY5NI19_9MICO|nr:TlpA disulfide reductase family protein [Microbacterium elymi]UUT34810.1 TlpA family protein disulfide reductase [Microbacterium elymi]